MYAPAQAMQQALNRRLQRQQMEQSADIADQNNAMQLLSQGQEAAQNDMSREAALERLKEQAANAVLRGQISADARVKQAETAADWHKDAAGKLLAGKMYGTDGNVAVGLDRNQTTKDVAKINAESRLKVQQAKPRPNAPGGGMRPTSEVADLQEQKGLRAQINRLESEGIKTHADWKSKAIDDAQYNEKKALIRQNLAAAEAKLKELNARLAGKSKKE